MDLSRVAVYATVAFILGTAVASGPLVSAVSVPEGGLTGPEPGTGDATVTVVSGPSDAAIERGEFDTGAYYLDPPTLAVDLEAVSGQPVLTYSVSVDGLQTSSAVYFVTGEDSGRMELTVDEEAFDPDEITESEYTGEVRLVLRGSNTEQTIYREPITVQVRE